MEEFHVKLDRYEGPYTKLLEMIESRKLSITEIGLASVADEYIAYIKSFRAENNILVDVSQFILVASTLVLMKARSLLPGIAYTQEEEKQIHNLEHKLALYASLTKASERMRGLFGKAPLFNRKRKKFDLGTVFVPDKKVDQATLHSIAILTLSSFQPQEESTVSVSVEQKVRIETVIDTLLKHVQSVQDSSFFKIVHSVTHSFEQKKQALVVNFLALLELIRLGNVDATQTHIDGDITITPQAQPAATSNPMVQ